MAYEGLQLPVSATTNGLYSWAVNQTIELRRILNAASEADTDLTVLEAAVTTLTDRVTALETDAIDGILTPQQAFELSLTTETNNVLGSISYQDQLRRTHLQDAADAAIAAAIDANRANIGVRTEVLVRAQNDLALAQQIDTVTASLGVTNANVTTLTQAVADGDSALSTQITSVQSSVAGNTASIVVLTESVDGVQTRFAVNLNAQNEVIGFIRLDGGVTGSNFTVAADNFYVGKVGTTGGTAIPVFAIQNVNGVAKIAFRGDMYADGTIIARHIAANTITADKLNVSSLSALSADLGTVTAGLIRNAADTLRFDLPNMRLFRVDGKADIDLSIPRIRFTP